MSKIFFSHPDKPYEKHISNMFERDDSTLTMEVKRYHDIAKLKENFQVYIQGGEAKDKNHSLLSGYLFLLNHDFEDKEILFGFLAIVSHHGDVEDFFILSDDKYLGKYFVKSKELTFLEEVVSRAQTLSLYEDINGDRELLMQKVTHFQHAMMRMKRKNRFTYEDFIAFKMLYASLIYSDKYEAIFGISKERKKMLYIETITDYIDRFPFHQKRDIFRRYVLSRLDKAHRLFTLTAPTGYGKTLTALEFASKFQKEKILFVLPFTSIIDQTFDVVLDIFQEKDIDIFKVHHKTTIDESVDEDRYSQVKFLMSSFSGDINITTLYQLIFALFGNKNRDNVKFNQLKNAVVIIDEAQAIPYQFRKDFIRLCEWIAVQMDTVFIFMSATMPIVGKAFREVSDKSYFKEQNRYILKWLPLEKREETLVEKVSIEAKNKHTLCVVNTISKAQELYLYFQDQFECYSLNGYMTDHDKIKVVKKIKQRLAQDEKKVLLISTQSIEAGIDLDFEVGFREVSPISSIIQTAGRVNRHFGEGQGVLYVFEEISGYSDLIYGDLQLISKALFEIFQERDIPESEIVEISQRYFEKINQQLERYEIEKEVEKLEFSTICKKIENIMDNGDFKELVIIEPYGGFIHEIEMALLEIKKQSIDKFKQKDMSQGVVKRLLHYGVNVSKNDMKKFSTKLESVKYIYQMFYLPAGAGEYSTLYGVKKFQAEDSPFD